MGKLFCRRENICTYCLLGREEGSSRNKGGIVQFSHTIPTTALHGFQVARPLVLRVMSQLVSSSMFFSLQTHWLETAIRDVVFDHQTRNAVQKRKKDAVRPKGYKDPSPPFVGLTGLTRPAWLWLATHLYILAPTTTSLLLRLDPLLHLARRIVHPFLVRLLATGLQLLRDHPL